MSDNESPSNSEQHIRQIHHNLGGSKEFIKGLTFREILLFAAPLFLMLVVAAVLPVAFFFPVLGLGVAGILLMAGLYYLKPAYLTLDEYILNKGAWVLQSRTFTLDSDGGDTTRYLSRIDHIEKTSMRRQDNSLVGAVRINPANMALETNEAWAKATSSFANMATTSLDFETQLYITSTPINPEDHLEHLEERKKDNDVKNNNRLNALIQSFINWYTNRINGEGANTREFYIIVTVGDHEIEKPGETNDNFLNLLADIPGIGKLFSRVQEHQDGLKDSEQERLKKDKLEHRLSKVREGANNLHGCNSSAVPTHELALLVKEYWSCEEESYADIENALTNCPITVTEEDNRNRGVVDGVTFDDDVVETVETDVFDEYDITDPEEDDQAAIEASEHAVRQKLNDIKHKHKGILAPSHVEWNEMYAVINDEKYVQTLWIEQFPEQPNDGFLERVLLETGEGVDLSIHIDPYENDDAADILKDWISSLQVTYDEVAESGDIRANDLEKDIQRAQMIRESVRSNQTGLFRAGVFIRIVANSEEELFSRSRQVQALLQDMPANCTPKVATRWQEKGLVTTSPIGKNELGDNRYNTMTGSAVGAMFPFSSNYYMDNEGIEYGIHGHNGSPVIIDPYDLDTGFNELVVGDIGSGKTFDVKKSILRTLKQRNDVQVVMLDPVQGFKEIVDTFDGETMIIGGKTKLNPLHIEPTPPEVIEEAGGDLEPYKAKLDEAMSFFANYFAMESQELGKSRGVLRHAIKKVYDDAGINSNIETHSNQSPTVRDVIDKLADISENPSEYDIASAPASQDKVQEWATELEVGLQPFKQGGVYENLAGQGDIDILSTEEGETNDMVYLDLQQEEGRGDSNKGFLMQLLLSTVYQQAKKTDNKVLFAIDEAHYLLQNKENLDYITQIVRHSRHVDMRLLFATQTIEEFYANKQARTITNQCSIKTFHKLSGLSEGIADEIGLTNEQTEFIRTAKAGDDELGYSEALVQVKEIGEYPVQVRVDDLEHEIIEHGINGPTMQSITETKDTQPLDELISFIDQKNTVETLVNEHNYSTNQAETLAEVAASGNVLNNLRDLVTHEPTDNESE